MKCRASDREPPDSSTSAYERSTRGRLLQQLGQFRELLVEAAIGTGLGRLRPRSSPQRLEREAMGFYRLLVRQLTQDTRGLSVLLESEVRDGAFAAARPRDVPSLFALWRGVLLGALGASREAIALLEACLDALELKALEAVRWDACRRVDLVVLCASAGGQRALTTILQELEPEMPATFLVLMHSGVRTPIPTLWARLSRPLVVPVVEGAPLLLGRAYVAPPARHLWVMPDTLHLDDSAKVRFVRPSADVLMISAARAFGPHVASVVLSGAGSDGAIGTRAVRACGGITLAQRPDSAQFASMPEAALATGAVEHMLPLAELGPRLRRLIKEGRPSIRPGMSARASRSLEES